jgi:hypothetical protein
MKIFPTDNPGGIRWQFLALALLLPGIQNMLSSAAGAAQAPPEEAGFRFAEVNNKSLGLWEGGRPVFVYNHGMISKPGVPADRTRSTYLHPIYGLDGEVLTDDFPKDHYHHRGLFWAWPHLKLGGKEYSTWDLRGIEQRFIQWTKRQATASMAVLGVENGWFIEDKQVVREQVHLQVHPATDEGRAIDVDFVWTSLDQPLTVFGAPGKSYGGFTLRFAPRTDTVITTPLGNKGKDLAMTQLKWADLSAHFAGANQPSGAAIFISPKHPDYPPTWLTRHYGVLCVGWPGVKPQTWPANKPVRCRYRVWIHRDAPDQATLQKQYDRYINSPFATRPASNP